MLWARAEKRAAQKVGKLKARFPDADRGLLQDVLETRGNNATRAADALKELGLEERDVPLPQPPQLPPQALAEPPNPLRRNYAHKRRGITVGPRSATAPSAGPGLTNLCLQWDDDGDPEGIREQVMRIRNENRWVAVRAKELKRQRSGRPTGLAGHCLPFHAARLPSFAACIPSTSSGNPAVPDSSETGNGARPDRHRREIVRTYFDLSRRFKHESDQARLAGNYSAAKGLLSKVRSPLTGPSEPP